MLLDHSGIKLEINNRKIAGKSPNTRRMKDHKEHRLEQSMYLEFVVNVFLCVFVKESPWQEKLHSFVRYKE